MPSRHPPILIAESFGQSTGSESERLLPSVKASRRLLSHLSLISTASRKGDQSDLWNAPRNDARRSRPSQDGKLRRVMGRREHHVASGQEDPGESSQQNGFQHAGHWDDIPVSEWPDSVDSCKSSTLFLPLYPRHSFRKIHNQILMQNRRRVRIQKVRIDISKPSLREISAYIKQTP